MKNLYLLALLTISMIGTALAQPVADFEIDSDTVCLGDAVAFANLSTCNGCTIVGTGWDLADGQVSNAPNPTNTYWASGAYSIQLIVEDNNGMTDTAYQTLIVIPCDVEIVVDANGCCPTLWGPPGFVTYLWSTGETTQVIQPCVAGTYQLTVTDQFGNDFDDTVTIGGPSFPTIVIDSVASINCIQNNGTGFISWHGEDGTPPYSYQVNGPSGPFNPDSISEPGTYTIELVDANGCSATATVDITNPSNMYLSADHTDANCGPNGVAWVNATGQNPPYTYLWNDPLAQTNSTATGLAEGTYQVVVEDNIGCQLTATVNVLEDCNNIINGTVYFDDNQNCVQDIGEVGIPNIIIQASSSSGDYFGSTDSNGAYSIATPGMQNEVSHTYPLGSLCPANGIHNVNFNQLGDTISNTDFAFYYNQSDSFDLVIHPGWTGATPGFPKKYWIYYYNNSFYSSLPVDAVLRFEYDPALEFDSCTQGGIHDAQNHSVVWQIPGITPTNGLNWQARPLIYFTVPASMSITDSLCSYFEILPVQGDMLPGNNTLDICEPVTGSRDPNAKEVIPAGIGEEGFILPDVTELFYTVHFQNNGNDTAFTVVVKDTLSEVLDPASVVPGAASHPYSFDISGEGVMTFRFDEILLPDSTTNEPESKGNFNFTVKLKPDLPLGTVIENTVGIYFDFNEPIITNTTVNTIHNPMSVADLIADDWLMVYPNPTNGMLTLQSRTPLSQAWLTDVTGRRLASLLSKGNLWQTDLTALPDGMYLIEVFTEDGKRGLTKVVKQ